MSFTAEKHFFLTISDAGGHTHTLSGPLDSVSRSGMKGEHRARSNIFDRNEQIGKVKGKEEAETIEFSVNSSKGRDLGIDLLTQSGTYAPLGATPGATVDSLGAWAVSAEITIGARKLTVARMYPEVSETIPMEEGATYDISAECWGIVES